MVKSLVIKAGNKESTSVFINGQKWGGVTNIKFEQDGGSNPQVTISFVIPDGLEEKILKKK